jgi:hypothetical protein
MEHAADEGEAKSFAVVEILLGERKEGREVG